MAQDSSKHITLSGLAAAIGGAITDALPTEQWVVAEVSQCSVAAAGHCYLSLVERVQGEGAPRAEMRAAIWAGRYRAIASYFKEQTGGNIGAGMKLLIKCAVSFHPVYGLSLVISDIDPTYTMGESERQRQLTLAQLKRDGIFDMQRELDTPFVVQRLAVISSATAAGYEDFLKQLDSSPYIYSVELFAAAMQGEQTERTVIEALDRIAERADGYDVVVIIRGGGSASDLRWFDSYNLASNVAQFPLPVFTGIGHEKDTSVTDMVAHQMFKTPTAVAAALVAGMQSVDKTLHNLGVACIQLAENRIMGEGARVERTAQALRAITFSSMQNAALRLEKLSGGVQMVAMQSVERRVADLARRSTGVRTVALQSVERQKNRLEMLSVTVSSRNPQTVLRMGYSIVRGATGSSIKSVSDAPSGTKLSVELTDGIVTTTVN